MLLDIVEQLGLQLQEAGLPPPGPPIVVLGAAARDMLALANTSMEFVSRWGRLEYGTVPYCRVGYNGQAGVLHLLEACEYVHTPRWPFTIIPSPWPASPLTPLLS